MMEEPRDASERKQIRITFLFLKFMRNVNMYFFQRFCLNTAAVLRASSLREIKPQQKVLKFIYVASHLKSLSGLEHNSFMHARPRKMLIPSVCSIKWIILQRSQPPRAELRLGERAGRDSRDTRLLHLHNELSGWPDAPPHDCTKRRRVRRSSEHRTKSPLGI